MKKVESDLWRGLISKALKVAFLIILVGWTLGCHRSTTPAAIDDSVEVEVMRVAFDPAAGSPVVILREKAGSRLLPIWIGEPEAQAILLKLHGIAPPRPLTSDLLKEALEVTGNRVDRVVINDLREQTFYAKIYLDHARYQLDSRPSDAIALALACKAPIYVVPKLFSLGSPGQSENPKVVLPQTRNDTSSEMRKVTVPSDPAELRSRMLRS